MNVGDVFFNTIEEDSLPGVPKFKVGYYKVVEIREGFFSKNLKPEHRMVYEIRRCTKDGSKLMKYSNGWSCYVFDEWVKKGRLVLNSQVS